MVLNYVTLNNLILKMDVMKLLNLPVMFNLNVLVVNKI
jgi:hypothetical protein